MMRKESKMGWREDIKHAVEDIEQSIKETTWKDIPKGIFNFIKGLLLVYMIIAPIGHINYYSQYCTLELNNETILKNTNIKNAIDKHNEIITEYNRGINTGSNMITGFK